MIHQFTKGKVPVIVFAVSLMFLATPAFAQWTPPTAPPPGNNVAAPINVSSSVQTKTGELLPSSNSGLLSVFYLWVDQALNVAGGAAFGGNISTGGASIEHTTSATGNRYSFIDFHGDDTYTDYGLRLIRGNSGPNTDSVLAHRGTGILGISAQDAGSVSLQTAGADRLFVNSSGNVGIGTTAPGSKLHIIDENNAGYTFHEYSNADGAILRNYRARGTVASPSGVLANDRLASFIAGGYTSAGAFAGPKAGMDIRASEDFTGTAQGTYLTFLTSANGTTANQTERMRIDNIGNVGIGTTNPPYKLSVAGDIINTNADGQLGASSDKVFRDTGDNWLRLRTAAGGGAYADLAVGNSYTASDAIFASSNGIWNSAGNVGIGTTAPTQKLDVNGQIAVGGVGVITQGGNDVYGNIRVLRNTSPTYTDGMYIGYGGSGGPLRFFSNSGTTERMTLTTSGNVGIGTTAPAKILDVNGDALVNGITVGRGGGNIIGNTANGDGTLYSNTSGYYNTASGSTTLSTSTQPATLIPQVVHFPSAPTPQAGIIPRSAPSHFIQTSPAITTPRLV